MIRSFGSTGTEDIAYGRSTKAARKVCPQGTRPAAQRKMDYLNAATALSDLVKLPTGFEALKGNLKGWYSMRVNDQCRIIFRWVNAAAEEVEIVDYH